MFCAITCQNGVKTHAVRTSGGSTTGNMQINQLFYEAARLTLSEIIVSFFFIKRLTKTDVILQ